MWQVYMLECSDKTIYTGITNDIIKRIAKHNSGKGAKYTRGRGPFKLLLTINCSSKGEALSLEAKIKKMSRKQKMALIVESI